MTPEELEVIKARHVPTPSGLVCDWDTEPWPCDTAVARAEVERLRGVVAVVQSEHYRVFSPEEPLEGGCICMADECPELAALAALEGKE